MSHETSTPPAEADAPDVSRLAADLRDMTVATVSDRPLPAGHATLLDRLLAGMDVIGPKRWNDDAATPRVPVEDRAMSWQFLVDVHASFAAYVGEDQMRTLNSYQIVGDKDLAGAWQGNFGKDPSVCLKWCVRTLAAATTTRSLVETILRAAALSGDPTLARDARGAPYFGRADVFVSYFWAAPLSELLAALDDGGGASTGARFFWVDIFAVGQCKHTREAAAYNKADVSAFETVLAAVDATWLWCKPWHAPATFGRVWCLFEALKTVDLGKELVLVMAADEQAALRATLIKHFDDIMRILSSIDVVTADATNPDDKAFIFGLIRDRAGGFAQFNADLTAALRIWLLGAARAELVAMTRERGDDDLEANLLRNSVARLLKDLGHYDEAEAMCRQVLAFAKNAFGENDPDVAESLNNLAMLLQDQDKLDEAEPMYRRALAIYKTALGENHPNVAHPLNNFAGLLYAQNKLADAEPMFRRALAITEKTLGENQPDVATSLNNLAMRLSSIANLRDLLVRKHGMYGALSRECFSCFLSLTRNPRLRFDSHRWPGRIGVVARWLVFQRQFGGRPRSRGANHRVRGRRSRCFESGRSLRQGRTDQAGRHP